ncbi:nuclear pore-associated protein 1 [Trichechus manatus latirostris]|uniref:Nuclear pore-associated protein 1 n=1 Tax=Trichechus manatus latirostris TaxID=127582 RepID=A0A2Y9G1I0_TRIMA|nr:nuclear pore-associated protein 1 [Trichechus manatus latirostris]
MHNFFSKLHLLSCRCPPPARRPPGHPLHCVPALGRGHPAAPATLLHPLPSELLSQRRVHLPPRFYIAPKRQYAIRQAHCSSLGVRPLLSWGSPPKKQLVLRTFGHQGSVKIPPPGRKWTLPLPLKQVVSPVKPVASSHPPRPCPKETEQSVLGESRKGKGKDKDNQSPHSISSAPSASRPLETNGAVTSSWHIHGPLKGTLHHKDPENSKAQVSPGSSFTEDCATASSCSSAGGALTLEKPDPDTTGPSGLSKRSAESTKKGLEEGHQPRSPGSLGSGKEKEAEKPSGIPSSTSACHRPCKRRLLLVPLPGDLGELPPPPKLPRKAVSEDLCLKKTAELQRNHTALEDKTEATSDCSATQSTRPSSLSAVTTTDSLSCTTSTLPIPTMSSTDFTSLSTSPPILCSPRPSLARETGLEERGKKPNTPSLAVPSKSCSSLTSNPILGGALSNENGGSLCFYPLVPDVAPSTSGLPTPPSTSTFSFQPTSLREEFPIPMLVDSPPFFSPPSPPLPVTSASTLVFTSQPITPTTAATTSSNSISQPVLDPDVTDMDTSPPSQAVIFTSPAGSGVRSLPTDMDTSPQSQAVIFTTPPGSGVSSLPLAKDHGCGDKVSPAKAPVSTNPPAFIVSYPTTSYSLPFGPKATPQPMFGALDGHQQRATSLALTVPVANSTSVGSASADSAIKPDCDDMDSTPPSQAVIFRSSPGSRDSYLPFPAVISGSGSMLVSSSIASIPGSTSLPVQLVSSPTATFRPPFAPGATPQPTFAKSTPGRLVFMSSAAPAGSGNFVVNVPAPGPSSTTGALNFGAGPSSSDAEKETSLFPEKFISMHGGLKVLCQTPLSVLRMSELLKRVRSRSVRDSPESLQNKLEEVSDVVKR